MERIKIDGFGIDRSVFLNEKRLKDTKARKTKNNAATGFNWGYTGKEPSLLALAILLSETDRKTALEFQDAFEAHIIAAISKPSFSIRLNIQQWLEDAKGNKLQPRETYIEYLPEDKNFIHKPAYEGRRVHSPNTNL